MSAANSNADEDCRCLLTGALRRAKLKQPADLVGWAKAENAKMEAAKKAKENGAYELCTKEP